MIRGLRNSPEMCARYFFSPDFPFPKAQQYYDDYFSKVTVPVVDVSKFRKMQTVEKLRNVAVPVLVIAGG